MYSLVALGLFFFLSGCAASASVSAGVSVSTDAPLAREPAGEPGEAPEARASAARTGNAWADCYRAFQPTDNAAVDLHHLTRICAGKLGLVALTPVHLGSQKEQGRSERRAVSMRRGRCYRAFAVGQRGIVDLDLAIFDPQGGLVAADLSRDPWSVAPPLGPFCPTRTGRYTLDIAVTEGAGEYLAQVWGTAEEDQEEDDPSGPGE